MRTVLAITLVALICAGCSTSSKNNAPSLSRNIIVACGKLPPNADTTKPEDTIISWCRRGMYLASSGELLPLVADIDKQPASTPWEGGDMPAIEQTANTAVKPPPKVKPIVLEVPVDADDK